MTIGVTSFPANLDDLTSLIRAVNRAASELTSDITAVDDEITVDDASGAPLDGLFWIEAEAITFTSKDGNTLLGCSRGANGTVPAPHSAGTDVYFDMWAAMHHNVLAAAIVATQTKLGSGASVPAAGQYLKGTGSGTSAWGSITSGEIAAALGFTPGPGSAAPALVKIASAAAAGQSALSFDDVFSDTYTNYLVTIDRLVTTLAADFRLRMRVGGSDDSTVNYAWAFDEARANDTTGSAGSSGENRIVLSEGNAAITQGAYQIYIHRPFNNTETMVFGIGVRYDGVSTLEVDRFGGVHFSQLAQDGFTLGVTSGFITTGVVRVYGLID